MSQSLARTGGGPVVGLIMGSESDWKTMRPAADTLEALGIACQRQVVSAHRTPDDLFRYAEQAERNGLSLIIAAAGGAAHLPGMTAAKTIVPVIGVPVVATPLRGVDALLSIMQMPAEIGVATVGPAPRGARQAALFAASILARHDAALPAKLRALRDDMMPAAQPVHATEACGMKVTLVVESEADFELMENAAKQLQAFDVPHRATCVGVGVPAEALLTFTRAESEAGAVAFVAASANGIDLACRIARTTLSPVLGVPLVSQPVESIDRFAESFFDVPSGVATFAIGRAGAINAALFAAAILSGPGSPTWEALWKRREEQVQRVRGMTI